MWVCMGIYKCQLDKSLTENKEKKKEKKLNKKANCARSSEYSNMHVIANNFLCWLGHDRLTCQLESGLVEKKKNRLNLTKKKVGGGAVLLTNNKAWMIFLLTVWDTFFT